MAFILSSEHSLTVFGLILAPHELNPANSSGLNIGKYTPLGTDLIHRKVTTKAPITASTRWGEGKQKGVTVRMWLLLI